ncbi:MAG: hypothetical protein PHF56_23385 [Desulfuromonadaceae bacterium]|nr:hypothetical protein [Desulfuromonadaceae bacterium]
MLVLAVIVFGSGVAGAASDVVTLKVAHFLPTSSNPHQSLILP